MGIGHTPIALYMLTSATDPLGRGHLRSAASGLSVNLVANVYPVMVQRYNCAGLVRVFGFDTAEPSWNA